MIRKSLSALLIFASTVALIVAYRFLYAVTLPADCMRRPLSPDGYQIADIARLRIWANNGQSNNALVVA